MQHDAGLVIARASNQDIPGSLTRGFGERAKECLVVSRDEDENQAFPKFYPSSGEGNNRNLEGGLSIEAKRKIHSSLSEREFDPRPEIWGGMAKKSCNAGSWYKQLLISGETRGYPEKFALLGE